MYTKKIHTSTNMADERIRLVILGGAGVGKSCIVKRFLFKTYTDKYRATVEDLYNREYDLGGVTLKVSEISLCLFQVDESASAIAQNECESPVAVLFLSAQRPTLQ